MNQCVREREREGGTKTERECKNDKKNAKSYKSVESKEFKRGYILMGSLDRVTVASMYGRPSSL